MLIIYIIIVAILTSNATINGYTPPEMLHRYPHAVVSKAFENHGLGAADKETCEQKKLGGKTLYEILDQIRRVAKAAYAKAPLGEKEAAKESVYLEARDILTQFVEKNWHTSGVIKNLPPDWYTESTRGINVSTREKLIGTLEQAELSSKRRSAKASGTPESKIYAARERYFRCMKNKALNGVLLADDAAKCAAQEPQVKIECHDFFCDCSGEEEAIIEVTEAAEKASLKQAFQACKTQDELLQVIRTLRSNAENLGSDQRASFFRCLENAATSSSKSSDCKRMEPFAIYGVTEVADERIQSVKN